MIVWRTGSCNLSQYIWWHYALRRHRARNHRSGQNTKVKCSGDCPTTRHPGWRCQSSDSSQWTSYTCLRQSRRCRQNGNPFISLCCCRSLTQMYVTSVLTFADAFPFFCERFIDSYNIVDCIKESLFVINCSICIFCCSLIDSILHFLSCFVISNINIINIWIQPSFFVRSLVQGCGILCQDI